MGGKRAYKGRFGKDRSSPIAVHCKREIGFTNLAEAAAGHGPGGGTSQECERTE